MISSAHWQRFSDRAARLSGARLQPSQLDLFNKYLELLCTQNQRQNLFAPVEPEEILKRHFLDSLTLVPALDSLIETSALRLIDVGAGAGFPGVPVKIIRPAVSLVLCERKQKKARFLKKVGKQLGLEGLDVFGRQAAEWPAQQGLFDAVAARAVTAGTELVKTAARLLKPEGCAFLMKTVNRDELQQTQKTAEKNGLEFIREHTSPCLLDPQTRRRIWCFRKTGT